jgi:hypothetical protein
VRIFQSYDRSRFDQVRQEAVKNLTVMLSIEAVRPLVAAADVTKIAAEVAGLCIAYVLC